jgi:hypothetical protein
MKNPAKKKLSALYYLIPVVYLAVIVLFLLLQFSAREGFQERVGNLTVAGSRSRRGLFGSGDIADVAVSFNDLVFEFDKRNPLLLRDSGGTGKRLALRSYSSFASGVELAFAEGVKLRFDLTDSLGDRMELSALLPRDPGGDGFLELSFRVEQGGQHGYPNLPLLEAENGAGRFLVSLPRGSVAGEGRLALARAPDGADARLLIERRDEEAYDPYLYWFGRNINTGAAALLTERRLEFREHAYRTWQRKPLGSYESLTDAESAGAAFLSEALVQGDYRRVLVTYARNIRTLLNRSPGETFPLQTSPYLGSLAAFLQTRQEEAARAVGEITSYITRGDMELFSTPKLIPLMLNHGPFSLVEEAVRLAESADLEKASGELLLGLLETLLETLRWIGDSPGLERQAQAIINTRLLPALIQEDTELYLRLVSTEPVDLLLSVRAGRLMAAAGDLLGKSTLVSIGRSLVSSALYLADETGSLPSTYTPGESVPAGAGAWVPPEAVYVLVVDDGYLPQEASLYRVLDPGTYIWSAAEIIPPKAETGRLRFGFSFPAGEAHYLLIQGVRPFKSLEMHEIPWNPDPQYFGYTDGWYYQEETQTLFVKLTHRRQEEEIILNF